MDLFGKHPILDDEEGVEDAVHSIVRQCERPVENFGQICPHSIRQEDFKYICTDGRYHTAQDEHNHAAVETFPSQMPDFRAHVI